MQYIVKWFIKGNEEGLGFYLTPFMAENLHQRFSFFIKIGQEKGSAKQKLFNNQRNPPQHFVLCVKASFMPVMGKE